jgi:hypothetical protein
MKPIKRSSRRGRRRSFLEPSGFLERMLYMFLAFCFPRLVFGGYFSAEDTAFMLILVFWWVVAAYYSIMFMYRITRALYYLCRR